MAADPQTSFLESIGGGARRQIISRELLRNATKMIPAHNQIHSEF